ncbi:MAG: complex I NDUFA9 subunit family protein [Ectothiorhodospiraceae bacterium]|jgi:NADH dehydrogenase|nr:complex I NDUFA9 subunit family protein [Ectothiorhodospiraceae bacterium]
MSVHDICILGGTGFIGLQLVHRLVRQGHRVKVLTRRRERHRELLVMPEVRLLEADVHDPAVLARQFRGCDTVINLIGILNERGHDGSGFRRAHVELALKVIEAAHATQIRRLLHMSALNADLTHGSSHYLTSKGEAENLVHTQAGNIHVTSFRPSVIFGPGDSFLNRFAGLLRLSPMLPLACPDARFAPVYVGDVVDAFVQALDDPASYGKRIDLCGPKVYTLRQLVAYTAQLTGSHACIVGLPDWASRMQAAVFEYVPGKPFSRDNYRSLKRDSVCPHGGTCPTALEAVAPYYLGNDEPNARMQTFRREARR